MHYIYREPSGYEERLSADTVDGAIGQARDLLQDGAYDRTDGTVWPIAYVVEYDDRGEPTDEIWRVRAAIHPDEPGCDEGRLDHHWCAPHTVVDGIEDNPGVFGNGAGVVVTEVCAYCAAYRVKDTDAQDPETGEQGLTAWSYHDPDERSLDWIASEA